MNAETGQNLSGADHLRQSIRDILTTPIGTRVMRRDYGSRLPELVDHPMNDQTTAEIRIAAVEALARWEPRIVIDQVNVTTASESGSFTISLIGTVRETGSRLTSGEIAL